MIQQPGQDEILVGVPSAGTLLDQHATLQRLFERLLARGIEQRRDGQTVVLWQVDGMDPLPTFDPRHVATIERLERRVIQVGEAARDLGKVLADNPHAQHVDVGPLVYGLLTSGTSGDRPARLPRAKAEELRHVLALGAKSVSHALATPRLFADERGVYLAGWAFLPPREIMEPPSVQPPPPSPAPSPPPPSPPLPPPPPVEPVQLDSVDPDVPSSEAISPVEDLGPDDPPQPTPRWLGWLWVALALLLLLLLLFLAWLLFPGMANMSRLDATLISPASGPIPAPRSEEDRRRGTLDLELPPPPPPRRTLQFYKPEGAVRP